MDWKSVGNAIADAAPVVGTALGGPVGSLVGGLVSLALGTDKSPEEVSKALIADPEAVVKLKALEAQMQADILSAQTAVEQELTKRQQADMTSDSWLSKNVRPLSFLWSLALVTAAVAMDAPADKLSLLIGLVTTIGSIYIAARSLLDKGTAANLVQAWSGQPKPWINPDTGRPFPEGSK